MAVASIKQRTRKTGVRVDVDAVKSAERLLDIISQTANAARALGDIKVKHADKLPKCAVEDLEVIITSLNFVHQKGRLQTSKVSEAKYLLAAYDKFKNSNRENESPQRKSRVTEAMKKLKHFTNSVRRRLKMMLFRER